MRVDDQVHTYFTYIPTYFVVTYVFTIQVLKSEKNGTMYVKFKSLIFFSPKYILRFCYCMVH